MTEVLLVELAEVVDRLLWFLLEGITEVLLSDLSGVAIPLPLAVPTLLLWIFGLYFSTTLTSLRSSLFLSSGGEAKNAYSPSSAMLLPL